MRKKDFLKKELKIFLVFSLVIFAIKFLPILFTFNKRGELYEKYYADSLPIGFIDVMILFYLARTAIVFSVFFFRRKFFSNTPQP